MSFHSIGYVGFNLKSMSAATLFGFLPLHDTDTQQRPWRPSVVQTRLIGPCVFPGQVPHNVPPSLWSTLWSTLCCALGAAAQKMREEALLFL